MSRAKLQLASVLMILPLGVGLCVLCLGESAEVESVAASPRVSAEARATTAAAIVAAPAGAVSVEASAEPEVGAGLTPRARRALPAALADSERALAPRDPEPQIGAELPSTSELASLGSAPERLSPSLRRALVSKVLSRDSSERGRLAAAIALAASPERDYVPELFRAAFPDAPLEEVAPGPISDLASRQALTAALRDPAASVAERALLVAALGPSQGYPEVASALEEAFDDPSPEVRGQVVIELAISEEPSAGDLLRRAAEDPSSEVRLRAVLALGADPAQQPALAAAYDLDGQDPNIKAAIVIQASEHAGTPQGASFLARVLRDETDPGLRDQALAALAVAAEADPEGLRAAAGPELPALLERARSEAGVSASADAERVLDVLQAG
jgi:HEAT repeat protein